MFSFFNSIVRTAKWILGIENSESKPSDEIDQHTQPKRSVQNKTRNIKISKSKKKNHRVTFDSFTRLFDAANTGNIDEIREILVETGNPNIQNVWGQTVLYVLVEGGFLNGAYVALTDFGIDPNIADHDGWTALHIAALRKEVEMCELLVSNGANPYNLTFSNHCRPSDFVLNRPALHDPCHYYLIQTENQLTDQGIPRYLNRNIRSEQESEVASANEPVLLLERYGKPMNCPTFPDLMHPRVFEFCHRMSTASEPPKQPEWMVKSLKTGRKFRVPCTALSLTQLPQLATGFVQTIRVQEDHEENDLWASFVKNMYKATREVETIFIRKSFPALSNELSEKGAKRKFDDEDNSEIEPYPKIPRIKWSQISLSDGQNPIAAKRPYERTGTIDESFAKIPRLRETCLQTNP